jgi:hypothetical protein
MKPILFLLMILAPAISPVFAQKQLPASIQPYAIHWGYSVKQMFIAAGYDVPGPKAEVDLVPAIETRSNEPRLDSTITYFGYDLNVKDSMPLFKNVYTYPQADMEVVTEYFYDFDHWTPLSRTALISDELGRLVDAFSQVYDEETGAYIPDSRIEFYPHEDSMTEADSFFVSGWSAELKDWYRLLAVWNTFDGAGRLRESLSSTELFEFPIVFLDRYYYNNDHELTGIESFNIDGEEMYPAGRESFWYADHRLVTSIKETSDGANGFIAESKTEYIYTVFGKEELVKSYVIDFETNDWKLSQVLGYVYDTEDRISMREEVTATEGAGWDRTLKVYDYFVDEHLASESSLTFEYVAEEWIMEDKTYYHYNETTAYEPVDPIAIEDLIMWPNPSSGYVQFTLKGEVLLSIYSPSGQLVRQIEMTDGDMTMDVSHFPSGTYYVKAKNNNVHYSGKLVVQQL